MREAWVTPSKPTAWVIPRVKTTKRREGKEKRGCLETYDMQAAKAWYFTDQTTLHGFKYAFDRRLHPMERFIWMAFIAFCTASAAVLVHTSLQMFYHSPTLTTLDGSPHEAHKLPFPAVTFCNVNSIFRYKAEKLFEKLKIPEGVNLTRRRLWRLLPTVGALLRPEILQELDLIDNLLLLEDIFDFNNITAPQAVKSMSQSCHDMVERCSWDGEIFDCNPKFKKRATFNGYCCSFNYDIDTNWTHHPDRDPYKLRASSHGPGSGLKVLLNPMRQDYLWGSFMSVGFSVLVHRAGLYPEGSKLFAKPDSEALVRIVPVFENSDQHLAAVQPRRRRCFFYDEHPLTISKTYSREACVLQCRAYAVFQRCGCIPFHYLKQATATEHVSEINLGLGSSKNEIISCSLRHLDCLRNHSGFINSEESIDECKCWPQCTFLSYRASMNTVGFDAVEHYVGDFYEGTNTTNRASVNVYFSKRLALENKRNIIYTVDQLMAKLGGLLSLFLGCSFVTAMEIVYFSILRVVVQLSQFRK